MAEMTGKIVSIVGAVVDVEFEQARVPKVHDAIFVPTEEGKTVYLEAARLMPDSTVRCIALNATEGMQRGMKAFSEGKPIMVPVGLGTLGRTVNVVGEPIDKKALWKRRNGGRFTGRRLLMQSRRSEPRFWKRASR